MRKRPSQTKDRVSKDENRSKRKDLSIPEIVDVWTGLREVKELEVRVAGVLRVAGEPSAVAAVITILGFVLLVLKDRPWWVCLIEGALGAGLVWMLVRKINAKSENSP